jgi:hypothetical protein
LVAEYESRRSNYIARTLNRMWLFDTYMLAYSGNFGSTFARRAHAYGFVVRPRRLCIRVILNNAVLHTYMYAYETPDVQSVDLMVTCCRYSMETGRSVVNPNPAYPTHYVGIFKDRAALVDRTVIRADERL